MRFSFFFDTHTGTLSISSNWTIGGTSVFNKTYNMDTGGFNTNNSTTPHTYKYISFPSSPGSYSKGWNSETVLWTNTRTSAFGGLAITLDYSLANYEYIKITFYTRYADITVDSERGEAIYSVETVRRSIVSASPILAFGSFYGGDTFRSIKYKTDTTLEFRGGSSTMCWPTKISGLK